MRTVRPFFNEWYPRLVRFLRARLGDADQAEDIAQEAFVRLLRCRPRNPKAWLFTVANNLASDQTRIAKGRARHLALVRAQMREREDQGPDQPLLRAEDVERVQRALRSLSDRDRALLLLHHEGFRYREIASQLGLAVGSIGSLLTRAQRRFARSYETVGGMNEQSASG